MRRYPSSTSLRVSLVAAFVLGASACADDNHGGDPDASTEFDASGMQDAFVATDTSVVPDASVDAAPALDMNAADMFVAIDMAAPDLGVDAAVCTSGDACARDWTEEAYLRAQNAERGDEFGRRVAISADGSRVVVSAAGEDSLARGVGGVGVDGPGYTNAGAVYVFVRTESAWMQEAYIKASNTDATDGFGEGLAISDDGATIAVGAYREDSGDADDESDNGVGNSGAVYVFTRTGSAWAQTAYLKANNPGLGDEFGAHVAISGDGNTLVIGAPNEDGDADALEDSGAAYVFARAGSVWTQEARIRASNAGDGDLFGASASLSSDGNVLAVGAREEDGAGDGAEDSGAAYVFARAGSTWSQTAYVKALNADADDLFGQSVALSGDGLTLAVGAHYEASNGSGASDDSVASAGAAYVFALSGGVWTQEAYLKATTPMELDLFGFAVSLSRDGNRLAVGAQQVDTDASGALDAERYGNSGTAYVFVRTGGLWARAAILKASNLGAGDLYGWSLALSADGTALAVGALYEDGESGDLFENSGAAYVLRASE